MRSDPISITFQSTTVNNAPYFGSVPITNVTVGELYQVTLDANDADSDPLNLTLDGPAGMALNSSAKTLEWTPDSAGVYPVKVTVSDGKGGMDSLTYNIKVISLAQISAVFGSGAVNYIGTDAKA